MFGLRCAQPASAAALGCAAALCPRGASGSGAGESATRLTQAEGEIDRICEGLYTARAVPDMKLL